MVSFEHDPGTQRMLKELGDFLDSEVMPLQERFRERAAHESRIITEEGTLHPDVLRASQEIRAKSAKAGFYAMHLPEEAGGRGAGRVAWLAANREVFRRGVGLTFAVLASIEGPNRMLLALPPEARARYLDPLVRGEKTTCFALTEPQAGSDVRAIETTARREGDEYVLNGTKMFITNGPYADFAQVFARIEGSEGPFGGITAFVVDRGTPGFRVGRTLETMVNNGLPAELHFEECRVPAENVIGGPGEGFWHALQNIGDIRIQLGGMCVGLAEFCLDRTLAYVNERKAFGKPIGKYQGVSFPLADCATEIKAAELLALYAAWKIDAGDESVRETSMTKLYATEMLWNVADRCVQAHGGHGLLREREIERVMRWARVMRIWEGTSEIQRQTIAKTLGL